MPTWGYVMVNMWAVFTECGLFAGSAVCALRWVLRAMPKVYAHMNTYFYLIIILPLFSPYALILSAIGKAGSFSTKADSSAPPT